jgi:hypothetical protein
VQDSINTPSNVYAIEDFIDNALYIDLPSTNERSVLFCDIANNSECETITNILINLAR